MRVAECGDARISILEGCFVRASDDAEVVGVSKAQTREAEDALLTDQPLCEVKVVLDTWKLGRVNAHLTHTQYMHSVCHCHVLDYLDNKGLVDADCNTSTHIYKHI